MSSTGIRGKPVKADFSRMGGYLFSEIRPVNSWLLIPSIRYDSYEMPKQSLPSYRMNTRWEYLPGKTLKAAAGTYNQTPQPRGQATEPSWGNPNLPLTTAIHYVVGHELDLTDLISLDVQGYYNQQKNIPRATDSINPVTGQGMNYLPDMDGRMYGMEVLLRHNLGNRFFGWVAYTLSRSERHAPTAYLAGYDFDKPWNPKKWNLFEQDQTHNLQVVASWKLPREWELGARFQYTTGNPETPHLGITENQYSYARSDIVHMLDSLASFPNSWGVAIEAFGTPLYIQAQVISGDFKLEVMKNLTVRYAKKTGVGRTNFQCERKSAHG